MLIGEYIHTIDNKKRIAVPAKFIKDAALKMDKEGLLTGADGIKKLAQSIAEKAHAAKAGEEGFNEQYNRLLANITTV